MLFLFFLLLLGTLIFLGVRYNQAQQVGQSVKEAHSNITVATKKRLDLVNRLIDIARSYGEHEKLTYIAVVEGESVAGLSQAALRTEGAITQLNTMARNYPDLKANQTYQQLMTDLKNMETLIQDRRERYNRAVREYNTLCSSLPFVFVAQWLGFPQAPYFDVANADSLEVLKDFQTDDGTILRQKLSGAGSQLLTKTKEIGQQGKLLVDRGQQELARRRNGAPTEPEDVATPSDPA
jgi:LemA protein